MPPADGTLHPPTLDKGSQFEVKKVDYYEFLQISPRADEETIHRVYRYLAARYHPDNPKSGNSEKFAMLSEAYEVLSDPGRRSEYDLSRHREENHDYGPPLSTSIDFMDNLAGETNRRLAVLAVLYFRRRSNPNYPEVPLAEIESRMGFPRDYLDFTTWYLQKKGYITKADNSDFTLTANGVDFVETQRVSIPVLDKLLTSGTATSEAESAAAIKALNQLPNPIVVLPDITRPDERRMSGRDRRVSGDRRAKQ